MFDERNVEHSLGRNDADFNGVDAQGVELPHTGSLEAETESSTKLGNTLVEKSSHALPEMSELYRVTVLKLAEYFQKIGIADWAISGSMQKLITGVQEVSDKPGDIDVVTTVPAVDALFEMFQKGELDFDAKAIVHEPKPLGGNEKYGKSKMLQIEIKDAILGSIEIEIFGEGGDPEETINSYGGSVQLGNPKRNAEIWKVEGGVQILSEQDQRRQYVLVLCNELMREASGRKEKIASRIISLLQYAETDPERLLEDLTIIENKYGNLPERLSTMVINLRGIIEHRSMLEQLKRKQIVDEPAPELPAADVEQLLNRGEEIVKSNDFNQEIVLEFLKYASRINLDQSSTDYKRLRSVYVGLYAMALHIMEHGNQEDIAALKKTLASLYIRNKEPRNLYILFLDTKVNMVEFNKNKKT